MLLETSLVHQHSAADAKIQLFRSLFRGRDDVYLRRFESRKTGKSGYAPACGNEWVRGICEKPRIKCSECQYRQFLPLTDEVIRWHLSGFDHAGERFVAGIYPMLQDETCFFLAVDFDKEGWREDSRAFIETLARTRSASEAFLYRRLETLPGTKGRFQLNVRIPIPFDAQSQMEVAIRLLASSERQITQPGRRYSARLSEGISCPISKSAS